MEKILIVDDIKANRILLKQMLIMIYHSEVIEACDGQEAVSLFEQEKPCLILMDINMPVMNGYESATEIKKLSGEVHTPIIFITALSEETSLSTALESGGDDFIAKPFSGEILESKINAHLRIRELSKQLLSKNQQLSQLNQQLSREQYLIEQFFDRTFEQNHIDKRFIRYYTSPMSTFSGDVFLSECAPQGGIY